MKGTLERLNYVWSTLLSSSLVQDPNSTTDSNIADFARILSRSSPVTPSEKTAHETIRYIYTNTREEFVRMVSTHGMQGLVLACDGTTIAKELGVADKVEIRWNMNTSEYTVYKIGGRSPDDGTTSTRVPVRNDYELRQQRPQRDVRPQRDMRPRGDDYDSGYQQKQRPPRDDRLPRDDAKQRRATEMRQYRDDTRPRRDDNRPRRDDRDNNDRPTDGTSDKKKKYEPKNKTGKKNAIPPISSKDQIDILKQLQSIKTYSEATQTLAPVVTAPVVVVQSVPDAPAVVITNDDMVAISKMLNDTLA